MEENILVIILRLYICSQPHSVKSERPVSPNASQDATAIVHPRDAAAQVGSLASGGDHSVYPPNVYAPQAQPFYYRG